MYALLKSQINGNPFLVISVDCISDLDRVAEYMSTMKLTAELYLDNPSATTVWTYDDINLHMR